MYWPGLTLPNYPVGIPPSVWLNNGLTSAKYTPSKMWHASVEAVAAATVPWEPPVHTEEPPVWIVDAAAD